jgi:hypothetical protein
LVTIVSLPLKYLTPSCQLVIVYYPYVSLTIVINHNLVHINQLDYFVPEADKSADASAHDFIKAMTGVKRANGDTSLIY